MKQNNQQINRWRIREGPLASTNKFGNNGAFMIPGPDGKTTLNVIASDELGWEHVSVSLRMETRCPTWQEMCFVKDIFWNEDEVAVQYHSAKADYVNCHLFTLHLWRPVDASFPVPPPHLVGPVSAVK